VTARYVTPLFVYHRDAGDAASLHVRAEKCLSEVALIVPALREGSIVSLRDDDGERWSHTVLSKRDQQRESARVKREAKLAKERPAAYVTSARLVAELGDQDA
jgi:hypothetical protein